MTSLFQQNEWARSTLEFADAASYLGEAAIEFGTQRFVPDATKGYVQFRLAHAFPVVTCYQSAFHAPTVARSFPSMLHQNFNWRHQVASYFEPGAVREDRIFGAVVAVQYPRTPMGGWRLTAAEEAPGIHGVAVIHKQARGVDKILGGHQSGRQTWTVSLEVDYRLSESAAVLVPAEGAKDLSHLAASTPRDFRDAGLWVVPLMEAPEELIDCWDAEKGMFVKPYRGHRAITLLGGVDGQVHFKGVGLVERGAEPTAAVDQMLAEDPQHKAVSEGLVRLGELIDAAFLKPS